MTSVTSVTRLFLILPLWNIIYKSFLLFIIYILYIIGSFLPIWSILQNAVTHVTLSRLRSEFESEQSGGGVGCNQFDTATTLLHYLARDAKSDAAACGFGGEEGYEYLLGLVGGYVFAVVADVDEDGVVESGVG